MVTARVRKEKAELSILLANKIKELEDSIEVLKSQFRVYELKEVLDSLNAIKVNK